MLTRPHDPSNRMSQSIATWCDLHRRWTQARLTFRRLQAWAQPKRNQLLVLAGITLLLVFVRLNTLNSDDQLMLDVDDYEIEDDSPIHFSRLPSIHPSANSTYFQTYPILWSISEALGQIFWHRQEWTEHPYLPYTVCDIPPQWRYFMKEVFKASETFELYRDRPGIQKDSPFYNKAPCFLFQQTVFQQLVSTAENATRLAALTRKKDKSWIRQCSFPSQPSTSYKCLIPGSFSLELLRLQPSLSFFPILPGFVVTPRLLQMLNYYRRPDTLWSIGFTGESQKWFSWSINPTFHQLANFTWGDNPDTFQIPTISYIREFASDLLAVPMKHVPSYKERLWIAGEPPPTTTESSSSSVVVASASSSSNSHQPFIPSAPLVAVVSNCGIPFRNHLLQQLMKYMPVDSYGVCSRNKEWPTFNNNTNLGLRTQHSRAGFAKKAQLIKHYMFTFSVENAYEPSYVTEKLWQSLVTGSIPVYLGPPDIASLLPCQNCIIDLRNYLPLGNDTNIERLATDLLAIASDESEWMKYQQWRLEPRNEIWKRRVEQQHKHFKQPECTICALKHTGEIPDEVRLLRTLTDQTLQEIHSDGT